MAENAEAAPQRKLDFPWTGQADEIACNLAFGHLHSAIQARLTVEGRIHAETCLSAIGAVAGFAAQRSLFAAFAEGVHPEVAGLNVATTKSGHQYFFGDVLNQTMFAAGSGDALARDARKKLWNLASGGAISAGVDRTKLPSPDEMFAHVARVLGGDSEGMPSVANEHWPHMAVKPLLQLVWPVARQCFSRTPGTPVEIGDPSIHSWPAIAACSANVLIQNARSVLDPAVALTLVMEAAIYASKIDPREIGGPPPPAGATVAPSWGQRLSAGLGRLAGFKRR